MEETAITLTKDIENLGEVFVQSGFFADTQQKSQAIVKVLAGREIGLSPVESMTGIHIIKGKIALGSNLMAAGVKKSKKYDYKVITHTEKECVIKFYEGKEEIGTSSFSLEDAKQAGVLHNDVWKKYPKNMLFARAMSNGVKWYCPDVFGHAPVYVPEEMGVEVDGEGEPINITPPRDVSPQAKETPSEAKAIEADIVKPQTIEHKPQAKKECPTCGGELIPVREGHEMAGKPRCINEKCHYGFPDCVMPNCNGVLREPFTCKDGKGVCCDTCQAVFKKPEGFGNYDGDNEVCQNCPVTERCSSNIPEVQIFKYKENELVGPEVLITEKHPYMTQLNVLEGLVDDDDERILNRIKTEVGYKKSQITHDERNEKAKEVLTRFGEAT